MLHEKGQRTFENDSALQHDKFFMGITSLYDAAEDAVVEEASRFTEPLRTGVPCSTQGRSDLT